MTGAEIAALVVVLVQQLGPLAVEAVKAALEGPTLPSQEELTKRIAALVARSKKYDAETDAAWKAPTLGTGGTATVLPLATIVEAADAAEEPTPVVDVESKR